MKKVILKCVLGPNLQPKSIVVDFEQIFIKLYQELNKMKFIDVFFHYTQYLGMA